MHRWFPPIALGALLLFLVQPLMAKAILPIHGGAAGVWTACLVFYQCGLLAGYLYAFLLSWLPLRAQMILHALLLVASLLFLPIALHPGFSSANVAPEGAILLDLARAIGLPYLLLASTSPLLQSWDSHGAADPRVFRWFAISNLGSLLGLLAYPFLIEPFTHLAQQQRGWTLGYLAYLALSLIAIVIPRRAVQATATDVAPPTQGVSLTSTSWTPAAALLTIALPACSTAILGASTTQMSQSGVIVPFLWTLPLTLYLASFVICFQWPSFAQPTFWIRIFWASCFLACGLLFWGLILPIPWQIAGYAGLVLACSMACHAQLYALRPAPRQLTLYYLLIAFGGALGGAFTGLAAPRLFNEYWEFHVGVAATAVLLALCEIGRIAPRLRNERYARNVLLPGAILTPLFVVSLLYVHVEAIRGARVVDKQRDFFGVVSVMDDPKSNRRLMLHGRTEHGAQPLSGPITADSTLYFTPASGVAQAIAWRRTKLARPLRLGVIGLGTGSLLTHARDGDEVLFYEISPAVNAQAHRHFSYLKSHVGRVNVELGDGRQLLARQAQESGSNQFDVLVIDAFAGDALPMHLLTTQALSLYNSHLAPGGVMAFQITNRYLDLAPILIAAAQELDLRAVVLEMEPPAAANERHRSRVRWCVLFPQRLAKSDLPDWAAVESTPPTHVKPWTDDFGSLWSALR